MFRLAKVSRSAAALVAVALVGSCTNNDEVLGPRLTGTRAIFQSYVALGNSITAGFQSGGITDATQRQSYAFLLAQQMGTRYAYPSLAGVGCPPPVINFQTQARPTGTTGTTCQLRNPLLITDILNNVAVPNASSFDPTANATPFTNALTSLFLGGSTQVQRALQAKPTFASIWIGNNDVLGFVVQDGRTNAPTGLAGMTPVATFTANYDNMIAQLTAGAPGLKGVLIGVVQVANAPIMFPASALSIPAFKAGFDAIAGVATILDPSCLAGGAGATSLINTFYPFQIRTGAIPSNIIACVPGGASGLLPPPLGDILVLDPAEQTTVSTRITAYNTAISAKANTLGWAFVDPNPLLIQLRAANTLVATLPNYGSATAPFGSGMSLDGVHPAAGVQREIANAVIAGINAKYSTTLTPVP
jgi:lysophospholipase L1-like esterase